MNKKIRQLAVAVAGLSLASLASLAVAQATAPANLDKLKQMKVATTDLNIPVVAQTGANADAIKENLKRRRNLVGSPSSLAKNPPRL